MRIGILGGTFNPIHNAHIQMARLSKQAMQLDAVLLMVASDPPHKQVADGIDAMQRFEMTKCALAAEDTIEASDLEILRDGKSYTVQTLESYRRTHPQDELFLIVGSDMLRDFFTWYEPERIAALATIVCVPRNGQLGQEQETAALLFQRFHAKVVVLDEMVDPLSSTEIRDRVKNGLPVDTMVPPEVERYIYEQGVYFAPDVRDMQEKCRALLNNKRYRHVMGTVRTAASLADRWGADPKQAQIAALLHDCAKYMEPTKRAIWSGDDYPILPVTHAFAGAVLAKMLFQVKDDAILRAIRLHSTGDAAMTTLDKVIYLADVVEPNRDFDGVARYREKVALGADEAMRFALECTMDVVKRFGYELHPATIRAVAYYTKSKKEVVH